MQSDIKIESNVEELYKSFLLLGGVFDDNPEIRSAMKKGSQLIINAGKSKLRSRLKDRTRKNLLSSFSYSIKNNKKITGVQVGFKKDSTHRGFVAHFIDKGTRGGRNHGIPGNRFWTETREEYTPKAQEMIMTAISDSIDKIIARN